MYSCRYCNAQGFVQHRGIPALTTKLTSMTRQQLGDELQKAKVYNKAHSRDPKIPPSEDPNHFTPVPSSPVCSF